MCLHCFDWQYSNHCNLAVKCLDIASFAINWLDSIWWHHHSMVAPIQPYHIPVVFRWLFDRPHLSHVSHRYRWSIQNRTKSKKENYEKLIYFNLQNKKKKRKEKKCPNIINHLHHIYRNKLNWFDMNWMGAIVCQENDAIKFDGQTINNFHIYQITNNRLPARMCPCVRTCWSNFAFVFYVFFFFSFREINAVPSGCGSRTKCDKI